MKKTTLFFVTTMAFQSFSIDWAHGIQISLNKNDAFPQCAHPQAIEEFKKTISENLKAFFQTKNIELGEDQIKFKNLSKKVMFEFDNCEDDPDLFCTPGRAKIYRPAMEIKLTFSDGNVLFLKNHSQGFAYSSANDQYTDRSLDLALDEMGNELGYKCYLEDWSHINPFLVNEKTNQTAPLTEDLQTFLMNTGNLKYEFIFPKR